MSSLPFVPLKFSAQTTLSDWPTCHAGQAGGWVLDELRRDATKHNGGDRHRAIINLMEDELRDPIKRRRAHAQITARVHLWEMDFVRMALAFPLLTHLDLTSATLIVAPGEGRSSSLRCDPSLSGFPHSHGTHSAPTLEGVSQYLKNDRRASGGYPSGLHGTHPLRSSVGAPHPAALQWADAAELWEHECADPDGPRTLDALSLEESPGTLRGLVSHRLAADLNRHPLLRAPSAAPHNATSHLRQGPASSSHHMSAVPGRLGMTWPPMQGAGFRSAHSSADTAGNASSSDCSSNMGYAAASHLTDCTGTSFAAIAGPSGYSGYTSSADASSGSGSSSRSRGVWARSRGQPAAMTHCAGPSGSKRKAAGPAVQPSESGASSSCPAGPGVWDGSGHLSWAVWESSQKRQVKGNSAARCACLTVGNCRF